VPQHRQTELEALARNGPVDVQGPLNEPDNPGSDDTPRDADASGVNARSSVPPPESLAVDGPATVPRAETARRGVQPSRRPATAASPVAGGGETREPPAGDPVVMNVRSPVLTYWRDRLFDTFDGARWVPGSELWTPSSRNSGETVYFPDSAGEGDARPRYVQTYFLRDDLPDFDGPRVRTERASRADAKYLEVPPAIEQLRGLAASITNGAGTDMDRLGRIATYLELTHELDVTADSLALTAQPPRPSLSDRRLARAWTSPRPPRSSAVPPAFRLAWRRDICPETSIPCRARTRFAAATDTPGSRRTLPVTDGCRSRRRRDPSWTRTTRPRAR